MKSREPTVFERRFVAKDQTIIREGEEGLQAFLIQSGTVQVFTDRDGQEVGLAILGAGEIIGEMVLLSPDQRRAASVRALTDCNLIVIGKHQFDEKLKDSDPTVRAMLQMLARRVRGANQSLGNKASDLAELTAAVRSIRDNLAGRLPQAQARNFANTVLPHLDAFLEAAETFEERFGD